MAETSYGNHLLKFILRKFLGHIRSYKSGSYCIYRNLTGGNFLRQSVYQMPLPDSFTFRSELWKK